MWGSLRSARRRCSPPGRPPHDSGNREPPAATAARVSERFVSEPIRPVLDDLAQHSSAVGEPILPGRFSWRDQEQVVAEVLEQWKELSSGSRAMPERYVRKHWYRIRTAGGVEMKIYFERQPRSRAGSKRRWVLFSLVEA